MYSHLQVLVAWVRPPVQVEAGVGTVEVEVVELVVEEVVEVVDVADVVLSLSR